MATSSRMPARIKLRNAAAPRVVNGQSVVAPAILHAQPEPVTPFAPRLAHIRGIEHRAVLRNCFFNIPILRSALCQPAATFAVLRDFTGQFDFLAIPRHHRPHDLMMRRILVVEDNELNRELLCDWLEVENYQVSSAATLEQAFVAIQEIPPDAVLLDVQLGDQDGLSIATWIRHQPTLSHIPVIAVTAHAMVTEQERIFQAGCNAYVPKPVDFKVLSKQLQQWLAVPASGPTTG